MWHAEVHTKNVLLMNIAARFLKIDLPFEDLINWHIVVIAHLKHNLNIGRGGDPTFFGHRKENGRKLKVAATILYTSSMFSPRTEAGIAAAAVAFIKLYAEFTPALRVSASGRNCKLNLLRKMGPL